MEDFYVKLCNDIGSSHLTKREKNIYILLNIKQRIQSCAVHKIPLTFIITLQYRELLDWLAIKEPAFKEVVDSYLANAKYEFDWYERNVPEIFEALNKHLPDDTYRLPSTLYPELYNISLSPYIQDGTFEGKVQIYTKVERNTSAVFLNSHNLHIEQVKVYRIDPENYDDSNVQEIPWSNWTLDTTMQQLKIYLSEFVNVKKMKVDIEFKGTLNDNMQGFYRSSYLDESGTLR